MAENIKAIRARIKSVESTGHITRAMELVASSKIKKATEKMEQSRYFKNIMLDAFAALSSEKGPYSTSRSRTLPALYIIIAGDRGLAGGYNNNIFRSSGAVLNEGDLVLPIGKRAVEFFSRRTQIVTDEFLSCERLTSDDCSRIAYLVRDMYDREEIGLVSIISTKFVSMLTQVPDITCLLPLDRIKSAVNEAGRDKNERVFPAQVEFEPNAEEVLAAVIPEYIAGVLYSSAAEAFASEVAARRSAMDTAAKNADAMHDDLSLKYNRARQGAITQEITEIVAGANA